MRINNNLMAMNTHRQLGLNNAAGAKSIEKLSSGLKINRAGDDAAGLAISEKMRSQIRGLNMASKNSQDGISLIQTAEGALNETHAILQRMRELAVQSSNDTNVTIDRGEIQKEMNQLSSEVNRIAGTTEFNTMKLLNGDRAITTAQSSVTTAKVASGVLTVANITDYTVTDNTVGNKLSEAITGGAITVVTGDFTAGIGSSDATIQIAKTSSGLTVKLNGDSTSSVTLSAGDSVTADANGNYSYNAHGVSFEIKASAYATLSVGNTLDIGAYSGNATISLKDDINTSSITGATTVTVTSGITITPNTENKEARALEISSNADNVFNITLKDAASAVISVDTFTLTAGTTTLAYDAHGIKFDLKFSAALSSGATVSANLSLSSLVSSTTTVSTVVTDDKSMKFQVGANQSQQMSLDIADMRAASLKATSATAGSQSLTIGTASVTAYYVNSKNVTDGTSATNSEYALDVSDATKAGAAITVINAAIENVSGERSKLGAVQNRLEHTIKNLDTSAENLQAAESRIRDVDMAKEMMNLTKNNILQQAAQAMLAQANQAPQGVLQLLR